MNVFIGLPCPHPYDWQEQNQQLDQNQTQHLEPQGEDRPVTIQNMHILNRQQSNAT